MSSDNGNVFFLLTGKVTASNQSPVSQQERSTVAQLNNVVYKILDFQTNTEPVSLKFTLRKTEHFYHVKCMQIVK